MADNSRMRVNDSDLRITVNNEQYRSTAARDYNTGIFHQLSASSQSRQQQSGGSIQFASYDHRNKPASTVRASDRSQFPETVPSSQYQYRAPQPVPPVREIVQETSHLLSEVDVWNPISLQLRPGTTSGSAASQFPPESHPLLVNISNSKYANLDASSSLAQNLLKNINLLGKAFSGSSVAYNTSGSAAASPGAGLPISSKKELAGERLSLKYTQPQSSSTGAQKSSIATPSDCDPVIANVLKSIGFNFDMSRFGSTEAPKEQQQQAGHASSLHYTTPSQPVPPTASAQAYDPLQQTQNLTTSASTVTAYDKVLGSLQSFSDIDKLLQKVRRRRIKQQASPTPAPLKEPVRSSSQSKSRRSSSATGRSPVRKAARSTTKEKTPRKERQHSVERSERHSGRGELRSRASPSLPRRYEKRERKSRHLTRQSSSLSPPSRHRQHRRTPEAHGTSVRTTRAQGRESSPRKRGTRARECSSDRKKRSTRSSSRGCLTSTGHKHHRMELYPSPAPAPEMAFPLPVPPPPTLPAPLPPPPMYMMVPPPMYPANIRPPISPLMSLDLPDRTSSTQTMRDPKKDDWEKNTEAFLQKLREPSRPTAAPPAPAVTSANMGKLSNFLVENLPRRTPQTQTHKSSAKSYRPTDLDYLSDLSNESSAKSYRPPDLEDLSDLSSVSSGSMDDVADKHDKSATSASEPRSKDTGNKSASSQIKPIKKDKKLAGAAVTTLKKKAGGIKLDKSRHRGDQSRKSSNIIVIDDMEDQPVSNKDKVCGLVCPSFLSNFDNVVLEFCFCIALCIVG